MPTLSAPFKMLIKDTDKWHIPTRNRNIPILICFNLLAAIIQKIFMDQQLYARHCARLWEQRSDWADVDREPTFWGKGHCS